MLLKVKNIIYGLPARFGVFNLILSFIVISLFSVSLIITLKNGYQKIACFYYEYRIESSSAREISIKEKLSGLQSENNLLREVVAVKEKLYNISGDRLANEKLIRYATVITEESLRYQIDPMLVIAIIATESSFRSEVVSHKGARGLMQLLPSTAMYISEKVEHVSIASADELFDEEVNLRLGVAYLAYLIEKTGNLEHAVIAYNYGPSNLKRAIEAKLKLPKKYANTVKYYYKKISSYEAS